MNHKGLLSFFFVCILFVLMVGSIGGTAVDVDSGSPEVDEALDNLNGEVVASQRAVLTPKNPVVPDVVEAFNELTQQGEWQGIYPNQAPYTGEICTCLEKSLEHPEYEELELPVPIDLCMPCNYDPTDCCTTRTLHFQGVARHPRPGYPAVFYLSRAGEPGNRVFDSEGVLWIAYVNGNVLPGVDAGERIGSTRLQKGVETKDTLKHLNKYVVNWINFDEHLDNSWGTLPGRLDYDHPGGMQAVGNVLAVALSGANDDSLPPGKVAFFDTSDPLLPVPLKVEIEIPIYKAGFVGLAFHPVLRQYFAVVGVYGYGQKYLFIYKSTRSDFNDPDFRFESYDVIMHSELEALEDAGYYQMDPEPQSMNIVVGENNRLYLIGSTNTKSTAPIIDGTNRMWLWEIGLPNIDRPHTILIPKAKADKNLHSYGDPSDNSVCFNLTNNLETQEANFAAGAGAYVSPTGELLYYAVSYWNLGIGGMARMAELRNKYVSHTRTCGYQLRDGHLDGPYQIAEGSTIDFNNDIPAIYPWVHMYDAKDFGPGNQVMMDFHVRHEDDYDDFSRLDGDNGFKDDMSSFRFCGNPGSTLEIYDATPSNSGTWEEQWEDAKTGNDGWIQCDGTGEVIEVPNMSDLGSHCRHLDSRDSDDFEDDADSARLLWADLPSKDWRIEGNAGGVLEEIGGKTMRYRAGQPGGDIVYLKIAAQEEHAYVNVYNVAPVIESLDVSPKVLDEGQQVTVNASWSDPGAPVVSSWVEWGDGTVSNFSAECYDCGGPYGGPVAFTHTYADNGDYEVRTCFDDDLEDHLEATCQTEDVEVNNVVPTLAAGADQTIYEGDELVLDPATFYDDGFDCSSDNDCEPETHEDFTATIDWGDGSSEPAAGITLSETPGSPGVQTSGTIVARHQYKVLPGEYTATICIADDDGGEKCDTILVTVVHGFMRFCAFASGSGDDKDEEGGLKIYSSGTADCALSYAGVAGDQRTGGVGARGKVMIMDGATVNGSILSQYQAIQASRRATINGPLTAGAEVMIHEYAAVNGAIASGRWVQIKKYATVSGDITAAGAIKVEDRAEVTGQQTPNAAAPEILAISGVDFTVDAGDNHVSLRRGAEYELQPDVYGDLTVGRGATLTLFDGTYVFRDIRIEKDAKVVFDLDGDPGTIVIDIARFLDVQGGVIMIVTDGLAEDILFRVANAGYGSKDDEVGTVNLGENGVLLGTYLAPHGMVRLAEGSSLSGALYGRRVIHEKEAQIDGRPALDLFKEMFVTNPIITE